MRWQIPQSFSHDWVLHRLTSPPQTRENGFDRTVENLVVLGCHNLWMQNLGPLVRWSLTKIYWSANYFQINTFLNGAFFSRTSFHSGLLWQNLWYLRLFTSHFFHLTELTIISQLGIDQMQEELWELWVKLWVTMKS